MVKIVIDFSSFVSKQERLKQINNLNGLNYVVLDNYLRREQDFDEKILLISSPIALNNDELEFLLNGNQKLTLFSALLNDIIGWQTPVAYYGNSVEVLDIYFSFKRTNYIEKKIKFLKNIYQNISKFIPDKLDSKIREIYRKKFLIKDSKVSFSDNARHANMPTSYLERLFCDFIEYISPFPESFQVIITNVCNISCHMCPYHSKNNRNLFKTDYFRKPKFMSIETFNLIAQEIGKYKKSLRFGNIEEPFMHPTLIQFVEIASKYGVPSMHISTNGTLLTKEKITRLIEAGVDDWQISINAISPESYQRISCSNFNYFSVVNNVRELLEQRSKISRKIIVRVSTILGVLNEEEIDKFINFWKKEGIDQITIYALSNYEMGTFREESNYFLPIDTFQRKPCISPWYEMYILPYGEIGVCCNTVTHLSKVKTENLILGIVSNETSLKTVWLNERFQNLRRSLIRNNSFSYFPCKECLLWASYKLEKEYTKEGVFVITNPWMKIYHFK